MQCTTHLAHNCQQGPACNTTTCRNSLNYDTLTRPEGAVAIRDKREWQCARHLPALYKWLFVPQRWAVRDRKTSFMAPSCIHQG